MKNTEVHRTVGGKRIKAICQELGLTQEDMDLIDEILDKWEGLVGQNEKKTKVAMDILKESSHISAITRAILKINLEFVEKKLLGGSVSDN